MKLKIKVLLKEGGHYPTINENGDWIDFHSSYEVKLNGPKCDEALNVTFEETFVNLGVAMQMPKGYELVINARSSAERTYGFMLTNAQGIIDNTYCGRKDEIKAHIIAVKKCYIPRHERICQFRVQLSQFATPWQRFKNLFYNGIKLVPVMDLNNKDRKGFGEGTKHVE